MYGSVRTWPYRAYGSSHRGSNTTRYKRPGSLGSLSGTCAGLHLFHPHHQKWHENPPVRQPRCFLPPRSPKVCLSFPPCLTFALSLLLARLHTLFLAFSNCQLHSFPTFTSGQLVGLACTVQTTHSLGPLSPTHFPTDQTTITVTLVSTTKTKNTYFPYLGRFTIRF